MYKPTRIEWNEGLFFHCSLRYLRPSRLETPSETWKLVQRNGVWYVPYFFQLAIFDYQRVNKKTHHFWLVVWNMIYIFPYIGNNHPNWRTHIFQRGWYTTNQENTSFHGPVSHLKMAKRFTKDCGWSLLSFAESVIFDSFAAGKSTITGFKLNWDYIEM